MLARTQWRVRTRFRVLVLRLVSPAMGGTPAGAAPLLSDLFFELGRHDPEVERAVHEIHRALGKAGPAEPFSFGRLAPELGARRIAHDLRDAVSVGRLVVEEAKAPWVPPAPHVPEPEPPPDPGPPGPSPKPTTFLAITVRDEGGNPVSTGFRLKLPDGEVRQGHTAADGTARVDGIVGGGTAKITFLELDDAAVA